MLAIWDTLQAHGILERVARLPAAEATFPQLMAVHTAEHVALVEWASRSGGGMIGGDTYTTPGSYYAARMAAGGCCAAVDAVLQGRVDNALALVRPPGHHAGRATVEGFCLFNNVAVAARHAQQAHGLGKVAVIDFDVHHGNGTQEIFYQDDSVLMCSVQLVSPYFYPGSGRLHETGHGRGSGLTVNVPLPAGVGDAGYEMIFRDVLEPIIRSFGPDLLLVSAGYDAHWRDPLAHAQLSLTGYDRIVRRLVSWATDCCRGRVVFVLEGGYDHEVLGHGVLNLCYALLGDATVSDPLGPALRPETSISDLLWQLKQYHLLA